MKKYIWVRTQHIFYHKYPRAKEEISFLQNLHRHLLKVKVQIEVFTNDREIEFFRFQDRVQKTMNYLLDQNRIFGYSYSCEDVGEKLIKHLQSFATYKNRKIIATISEDGENGVVIEGD